MKSVSLVSSLVLGLGLTCLACGKSAGSASTVKEDQDSSDWKHTTVYSTTGLAIEMDYQILHSYDGDSFEYAISPLWFNVTQAGTPLQTMQQIRVVLTPWAANTPKDATAQVPAAFGIASQTLDLKYAEQGRFTGQLADPFTTSEGNESGGFSVVPKLSVVVDGQWQNDSVDGQRDFLPSLN